MIRLIRTCANVSVLFLFLTNILSAETKCDLGKIPNINPKWPGVSSSDLRQTLRLLSASDSAKRKNFWIIVSNKGALPGADALPMGLFQMACQSRKIDFSKVASTDQEQTQLFQVQNVTDSQIGALLKSIPIQANFAGYGLRWVEVSQVSTAVRASMDPVEIQQTLKNISAAPDKAGEFYVDVHNTFGTDKLRFSAYLAFVVAHFEKSLSIQQVQSEENRALFFVKGKNAQIARFVDQLLRTNSLGSLDQRIRGYDRVEKILGREQLTHATSLEIPVTYLAGAKP